VWRKPLTDWSGEPEPRRLATDSLAVSATSPLGKMPSANHTRFCSRGQPADTHTVLQGLINNNNSSSSETVPRTVGVRVLEDGHGHHDGGRRGVERAGGPGLLQGGDGAAVLRGHVGVGTGTGGTHHALQGLGCRGRGTGSGSLEGPGPQRTVRLGVRSSVISTTS